MSKVIPGAGGAITLDTTNLGFSHFCTFSLGCVGLMQRRDFTSGTECCALWDVFEMIKLVCLSQVLVSTADFIFCNEGPFCGHVYPSKWVPITLGWQFRARC